QLRNLSGAHALAATRTSCRAICHCCLKSRARRQAVEPRPELRLERNEGHEFRRADRRSFVPHIRAPNPGYLWIQLGNQNTGRRNTILVALDLTASLSCGLSSIVIRGNAVVLPHSIRLSPGIDRIRRKDCN